MGIVAGSKRAFQHREGILYIQRILLFIEELKHRLMKMTRDAK